MSDPFSLRVLKALTAQIKTITPANGYLADLSDFTSPEGQPMERVFRGRDQFGHGDPLPMVSILEDFRAEDQSESMSQGLRTGPWRLLIQGFVQDDPINPTDPAYYLAADVVKAIVKAKEQKRNILGLGSTMPCVTEIKIGKPVIRPADGEVSSVAFFFLIITLTVIENLENPFA